MAIIKCPECNHEVSDLASHCPFCGVDIAGNLVTCPDCGKILLKSTKDCPNCGCDLSILSPNSNPLNKYQQKQQRETQKEKITYRNSSPKGKSDNSHKGLIATLLIVCLLLLGAGGYYFVKRYNLAEAQKQEYAALEKSVIPNDYASFLEKYPESKYSQDVKERMDVLLKIEDSWNKIAGSSVKADFVRFNQANPHSEFEMTCNQKIDSLDWINASTENTKESYQQYLTLHANGKFAGLCKSSLEELDKLTVSYQDKNTIRAVVNRYFNALSENNSAELGELTSDKVFSQSQEFIDAINPARFIILSRINVSKMPSQNSQAFNFVAKYQLEKRYTVNGIGQSTYYNGNSILSPEMKVIAIRLNKVQQPEEP